MLTLDATCGYRMFWRGKDTNGVVFIDIRAKVKSTIVADARCSPFRPSIFSSIYCDPPHVIRFRGQSHPRFESIEKLYSHWSSPGEWMDFLRRTNIEFHRLLKDDGLLLYKISDTHASDDDGMTHLRDLNNMTCFEIDMMRHEASKSNNSKTEVYYVIMRKRRSDLQTHLDTFFGCTITENDAAPLQETG